MGIQPVFVEWMTREVSRTFKYMLKSRPGGGECRFLPLEGTLAVCYAGGQAKRGSTSHSFSLPAIHTPVVWQGLSVPCELRCPEALRLGPVPLSGSRRSLQTSPLFLHYPSLTSYSPCSYTTFNCSTFRAFLTSFGCSQYNFQ